MGLHPIIRLPLLMSLTLVVTLVPFFLGAEPASSMALLFLIAMTATLLAVLVIFARGLQEDLEGTDAVATLEPTPRQRLGCLVVSLVSACIVFYLFRLVFQDTLPWYGFFTGAGLAQVSLGQSLNAWISFSIVLYSGFLWGHLFCFGHAASGVVCHWARNVEVDLLDIEPYQLVAFQPMRFLLVLMSMLSLAIASFLVLRSSLPEENLTEWVSIMVIGFVVLGVWITEPVFVMRDRIQETKERELELLVKAIKGDRSVLSESQISHMQNEFAGPDLLAYEQRIRNVWEWPVQGFVQRILLYVLLPPLAWVLAALVERLLDSVL